MFGVGAIVAVGIAGIALGVAATAVFFLWAFSTDPKAARRGVRYIVRERTAEKPAHVA